MDLKKVRKIPNSMKKGFKKALERLDAYQIDKYKMNNRSISMIDLVNIFKPKGNKKNAKAFEYLVQSGELKCNVKFLIEGEEEVGSPNLPKFCEENKELLGLTAEINV